MKPDQTDTQPVQRTEGGGRVVTGPLTDGFYRIGKGRKSLPFFVKGGVMWLPTTVMNPLIWMTAGKPLTIVDGRSFMRAADIIEEMPSRKPAIEALAAKHGLGV